MVIVTSGIAGLVTAVLVAALFLFRERRGETRVAPPVHGHHGLEVIWTAIPAVIVIALTGISWKALNDNEGGKADLKITVWGQQFDWTYDYPARSSQNIHQLVVPVNAKIDFDVQSKDVIHGWWVPAWRVQINATPGPDQQAARDADQDRRLQGRLHVHLRLGPPGDGHQRARARSRRGSRSSAQERLRRVHRRPAEEGERPPRPQPERRRREGVRHGRLRRVPHVEGRRTRPAPSARRSTASPRSPTPRTSSASRSWTRAPSITQGYPDQMPKDFKSKLKPEDLDVLVKALAGGIPSERLPPSEPGALPVGDAADVADLHEPDAARSATGSA